MLFEKFWKSRIFFYKIRKLFVCYYILFYWSDMISISMFIILKTDYFQLWFLSKNFCRKTPHQHEIITFEPRKEENIHHIFYQIRAGFKLNIVNRTLPSLHRGSLEITLTFIFRINCYGFKYKKELKYYKTIINHTSLSYATIFSLSFVIMNKEKEM